MRVRDPWTSSLIGASIAATTIAGTTFAGVIPNDECEGAIEIFDGDTFFTTVGATTSVPGVPLDCDRGFGLNMVNDIWHRYIATQTGILTVYTCNQATFDTRLVAYDACGGELLACNDDGPGCGLTSLMEVVVSENDELWIRLGGFSGSGDGTLTLTYDGFSFECPPSDHDCFTTGSIGCTDVECCTTVCLADSFCCAVAWDGLCVSAAFSLCDAPKCTFTCPEGASIENEPCGDDTNGGCNVPVVGDSNCCVANGGLGCDDPVCSDTVCAADSFCCAVAWDGLCAAAALDLCPDICQLGKPSFTPIVCGETICGTAWADASFRDTDWYEFQQSGPEAIEVTFSVQGTLPLVIGIVDTGGIPECSLATTLDPFAVASFCGTASFSTCLNPGTYWFFVAANGFAGFPCGTTNDYAVTLECGDICKVPVPDNDECAEAIEIFDGSTPFSTIDANTSLPPLDPACERGFGLSFVADIWYTYEATQSGIITVSTCNAANFDTRLAMYEGDCENLQLIGCNDDGPGCGLTSTLETLVTQGETYLIRVGGFSGEGTGTLSIFYGQLVVPNDGCENASPITDGATSFSTVGATTDGPPLPLDCDRGFGLSFVNDIWYEYVATCDGTVQISTCDAASFDTRLAAYTGGCEALEIVGCNDDGEDCSGFTSILEFNATCGETYLIRVGGFITSGSGTLTITCDGTCGTPCPTDLDGNGVTDGGDLGLLIAAWNTADPAADLDGNGVVDGGDLGLLIAAWGPCAP
jgi:hypothetical protein